MKLVISGLIVGNLLGGVLFGNWRVTLLLLIGQVSTMFPLWLLGYLRERD